MDAFISSVADLLSRHSRAVNEVVEQLMKARLVDLRRGNLDPASLVRLVAAGTHTRDPQLAYVERLRALICSNLPRAFQTRRPRNEREVQDAGDAMLAAAAERLRRELPLIPFAVVSMKPDFSRGGEGGLYLEFKYPRTRARLNAVITEMTSRVVTYRDNGASVLFIVYDPSNVIIDDDAFAQAFSRHENVWVGISR